MKSAREIAADILSDVDEGALSNVALTTHLKNHNLISSDRDMVKLLVNGTLEHINEIDRVINANSKKKASAHKPIVRNVLRISIFQLYYLRNIPASAVCNEAVKIIDRRNIKGLKPFVNAFLRNIAKNVPESISDRSEIPEYLYSILKDRAGDKLEDVINAIDSQTKVSCRFNLSKADKDDILQLLEKDNIKVTRSDFVRNGYYLEGYDKISDIEAFNMGYLQIQGISSIKAVEELNPKTGSKVLDICAAPGGKTIAIADIVGPTGCVISRDLTEKKVRMIISNAKRCGMNNIIAQVKDATVFYSEDEAAFDYVLADLPCSGLGTIGHKIEIRNRMNMDKVRELSRLQRQILDNAVRYVKPGGKLLYSTCTITREENEENSAYIESLGLKRTDINDTLLLPGIDEVSDGFFYSLFTK